MAAPLRQLAEGLWVADRPFRVLGSSFLDIGTRMTVAPNTGGRAALARAYAWL